MSIEIENLSFSYDGINNVINKVSLVIDKPQIVGIVGQTGSGKSTLAQLIAGLIKPGSGSITVDGKSFDDPDFDWMEFRQKLGIVFQYPETQLFEQTVVKDVAFGLKNSKLGKEDILKRVKETIELMNLDFDAVKFKSPLALSGGEKRKVAIAGVLATKPKYLILDEPIAGLDPMSREEFLRLLCKLRDEGTTVIMVSHNADSLAEYADRIILMDKGEIVMDGSAEDVYGNYELLKRLGIGTCSAQMIVQGLRAAGFDVNSNVTRYEELLEEVISWART